MSKYYEYFASGVEGRQSVLEGSCTRCIWGAHKLGIGNVHQLSPFNWRVCRDYFSSLIVESHHFRFGGNNLQKAVEPVSTWTVQPERICQAWRFALHLSRNIRTWVWSAPKNLQTSSLLLLNLSHWKQESTQNRNSVPCFLMATLHGRMWSQGLNSGLPVCQAMTDLLENEAPKILEKIPKDFFFFLKKAFFPRFEIFSVKMRKLHERFLKASKTSLLIAWIHGMPQWFEMIATVCCDMMWYAMTWY